MSVFFLFMLATQCVAQQCQPFQLQRTPVAMYGTPDCSAFRNSSCCDFDIALRSQHWAQIDSCGDISHECASMLSDIACHINCAPNMQTRLVENIYRPVVCTNWVHRIYNACSPYHWCTNRKRSNMCGFAQMNAWTKCTPVRNFTEIEFAHRILNVEPYFENCTTPRSLVQNKKALPLECIFLIIIGVICINAVFN